MNKRLAAYANFAFSLSALGINIVSGLVFVPLYLRHIDDATYGAWFASGAVISMVGLIESGLSTVVTQKLVAACAARDNERFACIAGTGVAAATLVALVVSVLGGIAALVSPWIFDCPEAEVTHLQIAVGLAAVGAGTMMLSYTLGAIPQALQVTGRAGLYFISAMICGLAATWIGLQAGLGVIALGLGPLCSGLAMFAGCLVNLRRMWRHFNLPRMSVDRTMTGELWRDARALLFGRASSAFSSNLQAPAAAIAVSAEASTMLSLTGRVLSLVPVVIDRIGTAAFAGAAHVYQRGREECDLFVREIMTITIVLSGLGVGLALCFTAPLMRLWVGETRYAGDLVLWLLVANACLAMRQSAYANLLTAFGRAGSAGRWLGFDAVIRLVLIIGLTPWLLLPGILASHLLATTLSAIVLARVLQKKADVSGRVLWLSGGVGFLLGVGSAVAWRLVVPEPRSWLELTVQAAAYSGAGLLLTAGLDRAWRQILLKNMNSGARMLKRATAVRTAPAAV